MTNWKNFWGYIKRNCTIIIAIVLLVFCIGIIIYVRYYLIIEPGSSVRTSSEYIKFNYDLSSSFNNWVSPFIAIVAASLTFLAFYMQKKSNDLTKEQFAIQNIMEEIRSLESFGLESKMADVAKDINNALGENLIQTKQDGLITTRYYYLQFPPFRPIDYVYYKFFSINERINELKSDNDLFLKLKSVYTGLFLSYFIDIRESINKIPQNTMLSSKQLDELIVNPILIKTLEQIDKLEKIFR